MDGQLALKSKETLGPLLAIKVEGKEVGYRTQIKGDERFNKNWNSPTNAIHSYPFPESVAVRGFLDCLEVDRLFHINKSSSDPASRDLGTSTEFIAQILSLQAVEGGFLLDETLCEKLGIHFSKLEDVARALHCKKNADLLRLVCTAVIFQVLEMHFENQRPLWEGSTQKSRIWYDNLTIAII